MKSLTTKKIAIISIIAALYFTITIVAAPISYGVVQCRISEALTVLPMFTIFSIFGLTIGCVLSNIYGCFATTIPIMDIFVGSFATLISAIFTYVIGKKVKGVFRYILGPLPAVIFNGLIIGSEITITEHGNIFLNMLSVGLGELASCYLFGVPLMIILYKNNIYKKIF